METATDSRMRGTGIAPGYAVGFALVCDYAIERQIELPPREILNSEVAAEHAKLAEALEMTGRDRLQEELPNPPSLRDGLPLADRHVLRPSPCRTHIQPPPRIRLLASLQFQQYLI